VLLVLASPPSETGNGLAMRAQRIATAFAKDESVALVLPATSATFDITTPLGRVELDLPSPHQLREGHARLLGTSVWRERMIHCAALPELATRVTAGWSSWLVDQLAGVMGSRWTPEVVVVQRSYLAPVGLAIAERFTAVSILDLDDDDEQTLQQWRDQDSGAFGRLVATFAPEFDVALLASPTEAAALADRYPNIDIGVFPNSIDVRSWETIARVQRLSPPVVAMVGNFSYEPNAQGLRWFLEDITPILAELVPGVRFIAAGRGLPPRSFGHNGIPVTFTGELASIAPVYAAAHAVAVPLLAGGGTRIKVLEAMAARRPVVSTPVGVAGLVVQHDHDILIADTADAFARGLRSALIDSRCADGLVAAAHATVSTHYNSGAISSSLRRMVEQICMDRS
jgi:polysaccharide biosynthesis protein PslH